MHALVSTQELRGYGYRVAQVTTDDKLFSVALGLFWYPCADSIDAEKYFYDPATAALVKIEENTEGQ